MNQEGGEPEALGPLPVSGYAYGPSYEDQVRNCSKLFGDEYQEPTHQHGCRTKGNVSKIFLNFINSDFTIININK